MPPPTPEKAEDPLRPDQARQLSEFMGSEEFQKLPLSQKFAKLREFMGPKPSSLSQDLEVASQSERNKRLNEFWRSEEFQKLEGPARIARLRRFMTEEFASIPQSEAEKRIEEHARSKEAQEQHRALVQAEERLQAIRLLSSARKFLRELGPALPPELVEIAREEGLDLPEVGELSPRLRDALKRAGWDEPAPMRDH